MTAPRLLALVPALALAPGAASQVTWKQLAPSASPSARALAAVAYQPSRRKVVLFGGWPARGPETWAWDGRNWVRIRTTASPMSRIGHAMADDSRRGRMVLFGGVRYGSPTFSDTWEYDGRNWTQRHPAVSPTARENHAMAYDAARGVVLMFGGGIHHLYYYGDTWIYPRGPKGYEPFGSGCGVPRALLQGKAGMPPKLGGMLCTRIRNLPRASTIAVLAIGTSKTRLGPFSLPIDLAPFGMPGCRLYQSTELQSRFPVASGTGTWSLPIPNDSRLADSRLHLQGFVVAPRANPAGALVTNGLTARIFR